MKAIIPVAGAGVTLRPHTHTQPKPLIPVAGRPMLAHIVDALRGAGIEEFVFVIGYLGEKIKDFVTQEYEGRIRYQFITQEPRRGLAHAIWLCRGVFAPGEEAVITLGDTIIDADLREFLDMPSSCVAVQEVEVPGAFGIVGVDEQGFIQSLIEKPAIPKSNLALVGFYKIMETALLFESIGQMMKENTQATEYNLTDALARMVAAGTQIRTLSVKNWYDCGEKATLLATNRILMARLPGGQGPSAQARYPDSVIIEPVVIPPSAVIAHSVVGPYVAVGEHSVIQSSLVQDTIVGTYSTLEHLVLRQSIVGNDTTLRGRWQTINLGDNTELDFNM